MGKSALLDPDSRCSRGSATKILYGGFHAFIQPRDRTGDNPRWTSTAPFWDDQYTLWDMWRTLYPLMAIVDPQMLQSVVNSFIDRHRHDGYAATAFIQGQEFDVGQGGDEVDNVIADASVKQIPGVDWQEAYAVLKSNADQDANDKLSGKRLGERRRFARRSSPNKSGSGTLAFAYNDFCVAQVAKRLDNSTDYEKYLSRSANWKNVWDDSLKDGGFTGFPRSRHTDGTFSTTAAIKGFNTDFYEGTCWVYSFSIPQDVPGMVEKMGGRETFIRRLAYALDHNLIDFTNEPSFYTIWWLSAVGRRDLTNEWAAKLASLYSTDGYPGDEDSGAMSSLYVFLTAGFMPIAGQDIYYLHEPQVPKVVFHLPNGKTLTVISRDISRKNDQIQSVRLNGLGSSIPGLPMSNFLRAERSISEPNLKQATSIQIAASKPISFERSLNENHYQPESAAATQYTKSPRLFFCLRSRLPQLR